MGEREEKGGLDSRTWASNLVPPLLALVGANADARVWSSSTPVCAASVPCPTETSALVLVSRVNRRYVTWLVVSAAAAAAAASAADSSLRSVTGVLE